jgi:ABC-type sugar transport system ATPase subunit
MVALTMPHPCLDLAGVSKRIGPTTALDGVELSVAPAEVHAIVGENGVGNSTLMKTLSGAVMPDAGMVHLDGEPYRPRAGSTAFASAAGRATRPACGLTEHAVLMEAMGEA